MVINNTNYKHYLITRFNLRQSDWTNDKSYNPLAVVNDDWLKERFELFEKYCFPSVLSQIDKDFTWLVYFDIDTPVKYREVINAYQQVFSNFAPKFIPSMQHLFDSLKIDIVADIGDIIISSRLDNDDSLHEDYMMEIHKAIETDDIKKGVIDIPDGYCLKTHGEDALYKSIQQSNAFITYLSPYQRGLDVTTVMDKPHHKWAYSVETFVIKNKSLWMQIIHEKNVLNKVQGVILNKPGLLKPFNLNVDINVKRLGKVELFENKYLQYPVYLLKKKIKKIWLQLKSKN